MKQHFGKYLGPTLIDESQPLTVWRTWRLAMQDGEPRLTATWKPKWVWEPGGGVTVAECLAVKNGCNVSMKPECDCGLWGAVALTNLLRHGAVALYPTGMLGRAHLWGFVHVYEYGFRASMGRPTAGWLGSSAGRAHAGRIADAYKIPVELGLPVEVVVDPDLISPKRVLAAASAYMAAQTIQAFPAPESMTVSPPSGSAPATSAVRWPGRRCSRCGIAGHRSNACTAAVVKV